MGNWDDVGRGEDDRCEEGGHQEDRCEEGGHQEDRCEEGGHQEDRCEEDGDEEVRGEKDWDEKDGEERDRTEEDEVSIDGGGGSDASAGDDAAAERRLFGDQRKTFDAIIACELGVARASLAGDRVGEVGIENRCQPTTIAATKNCVAVGTEAGVFVDEGTGFEQRGNPFEVAAIGGLEHGTSALLAATTDGHVRRWSDEGAWHDIGTLDGPNRFCGPFLAASDGVFHVGDSLEHLGLSNVDDLATFGESESDRGADDATSRALLSATEDGLYRYTDEDSQASWEPEHERPTTVVVTDGDRAHAVDTQGVIERVDGSWQRISHTEKPVDICYAERLCGITDDGDLLLEAGDEAEENHSHQWRTHPLGLRGVVELAIR